MQTARCVALSFVFTWLLTAQATDQADLKLLGQRLHAAFGANDVNGVIRLWNERAPNRAKRKTELEKLLQPGTSVQEYTVRDPEIRSDHATLRIQREVITQRPSASPAKENQALALECVKEAAQWTIWEEMPAAKDVALRLSETADEKERNDLLARNSDLPGSDLTSALLERGNDLRHESNLRQALDVYTLANTMAERVGTGDQHARALNNIGLTHYDQGNYSQALDWFAKSLAISEGIHDDRGTARTLNNIGSLYSDIGDPTSASQNFEKSLALGEKLHNDRVLANGLGNMGNLSSQLGDYYQALVNYTKSYKLYQTLGDQTSVIKSLVNIGNVFVWQGNYDQAEDHFQRALSMAEPAGFRALIADALMDSGEVSLLRGDVKNAVEKFEKSLAICDAIGDKPDSVPALAFLARAYEALGNEEKAFEFFRKSLDLQEKIGGSSGTALVLSRMAAAYNRTNRFSDGAQTAASAIKRSEMSRSDEALWRAHLEAGNADIGLGETKLAQIELLQAIKTIEKLRLNVAGGEVEHEHFFEDKLVPYHRMVDLLVSSGRNTEAFEFVERARARVLIDIFTSGRAQLSNTMSDRDRQEDQEHRTKLATINTKLRRATDRSSKADPSLVEQLTKELDRARLDYAAFQTTLYAEHPEWKLSGGDLQPITLEKILKMVPGSGTAFVEFVVTGEKLYTFVVTGKSAGQANLKVFTRSVKRQELVERVHAFQNQLATRDLGFRSSAAALYQLIVGPAAAELAGKQNLVLLPDGVLWDLPFQALVMPSGRYVLDSYAVSYAPSLTALSFMTATKRQRRQAPAKVELLAMGNPAWRRPMQVGVTAAFHDDDAGNLPLTETEVVRIGHIYGEERSRIYVGWQAQESRFHAEANDADIVHLATHGVLNNASPLYSYLLLAPGGERSSDDGLLEVWELLRMKLQAQLVVLSACDTARGMVGEGEGIIGLSWALFVAGAPTTVLSQWKVESDSTSQLMVAFHENRKNGMNEAAALRSAALRLRRSAAYTHPFYWAPFVVIGAAHL